MTTELMRAVDERSAAAKASGALRPMQTEQAEVFDGGLRFVVRWASTLAGKDAASLMPGGPRDPNFNPFLNPEPALTVGPLGDRHTAILNKFPICDRHLVIARREFAEQLSPLDLADFRALALVICESGGLGFYNGGAAAGASQRHKHVQWLPEAPDNPSLAMLATRLPADQPELSSVTHPGLPMKHCFVRVDASIGTPVEQAARSMHRAFELACMELEMEAGESGLLPPFNLLVGSGWMLVVPRSREHFGEVSINALTYGGAIYVRQPEQIETIRQAGPLQVLREVAC